MADSKVQVRVLFLIVPLIVAVACGPSLMVSGFESDEKQVGSCQFTPIYFEGNSAIVRADSIARLKSFAVCIRKAARPIRLAGHSDRMGAEEYRKKMGKLRALAVKNHLVRNGVIPALITTYSYGRSRMLCQGDYRRCAPLNRRVEMAFQ